MICLVLVIFPNGGHLYLEKSNTATERYKKLLSSTLLPNPNSIKIRYYGLFLHNSPEERKERKKEDLDVEMGLVNHIKKYPFAI